MNIKVYKIDDKKVIFYKVEIQENAQNDILKSK